VEAWEEQLSRLIVITAKGQQWTNGRHRSALITAAGAARVVVVDLDWTLRRAGRDIQAPVCM
jgi:hypothetical protein